MNKTIAIVEGDQSVRRSTATLVESAGYDVLAFVNGDAFLAAELNKSCDCVVLDIGIPGSGDLHPLRVLAGRDDSPPALATSAHGGLSFVVEAMKLGAADFLEKPYRPTALLEAIAHACAFSEQERLFAAPGREAAARLEPLSTRLRQVLRGMVLGRPNKIIAYELGLSIRTVEAYRARLMTKLGVSSTAEAIRVGLAAGLHAKCDGSLSLAQPPRATDSAPRMA